MEHDYLSLQMDSNTQLLQRIVEEIIARREHHSDENPFTAKMSTLSTQILASGP